MEELLLENQKIFISSILDYTFLNLENLEDVYFDGKDGSLNDYYKLVKYGENIVNFLLDKYPSNLKNYYKNNLYKFIEAYGLEEFYDHPSKVLNTETKNELFYALLGAVAYDSNWNIEQILRTFNALFDINYLEIDKKNLDIWKIRDFMDYCTQSEHFENYITINNNICSLELDGFFYTTIGKGKTLFEARNDACSKMICLFINKGYIR